jgi:hypothetical protein
MPRQRLRTQGSPLANAVARILVVLLGAALAYYGLMLVLLALKVSPAFVNDVSGYRTAFDYLAALSAGDISRSDRIVTAIVALLLAAVAAFLIWRGLPRPHLARHAIELSDGGRGTTEIGPRAVERAVESAALAHPAVVAARARYDDDGVVLLVTARHAATLAETLHEVEERAFESLAKHELELGRIDVMLAGYDTSKGRELA